MKNLFMLALAGLALFVAFPAAAQESGPGAIVEVSQVATLDINLATIEELRSLPGIGPVIAQRIVDYREQQGPFENPAQLMEVKGVGTKTFEKIKDLISVTQMR